MGKEVRFLNSVKKADGGYSVTYGADDFNKMVSCLIGCGVAPFPSKSTYSLQELTQMTEAVVGSGASLDGLKVSLSGNTIKIAEGIGFFSNGATIEVDSAGVTLSRNSTNTIYVYAAYDASLNTCDFYTKTSEPSETDTYFIIKLAKISSDGTVTDLREIARSKVGTMGRNVTKSFVVVERDVSVQTSDVYYSSGEDVIIWEESLNVAQFNLIKITGGTSWTAPKNINETAEIEDGGVFQVHYSSYGSTTYNVIYCRYSSGKLQLYVPGNTKYCAVIHNLQLELY